MPNWCQNKATLTPLTEEAAAALRPCDPKSASPAGLLNILRPMPEELNIDALLGDAMTPEQQANMTKHGHRDWYSWRVDNWGTKWEVDLTDYEWTEPTDDAPFGTLLIDFDSAWAPPIEAFEFALDRYRSSITYFEGGMGFAGAWRNGEMLEEGEVCGLTDGELELCFPRVTAAFDLHAYLDENGEPYEDC
jgi:hypothetical protein